MQNLQKLIFWALRAWPVWAIAFVIAVHLGLVSFYIVQSEKFNKVMSAILQIVGGLLVLISLNDNIGTFTRTSLTKSFKDYLYSFPLLKRGTIFGTGASMQARAVGSGEGYAELNFTDVTKQLEELAKRIRECRELVIRKEKEIRGSIQSLEDRLNSRINDNSSSIIDLRNKIENNVLGSLKMQVFGVMLVFYAAVISVLT